MGICCAKENLDSTPKVNSKRPKGPQGTIGYGSAEGFDDNLLHADTMMNQQRKMSRAQIAEQQNHFLSFKDNMKFKTIDNFAQIYSIRKELGAGAFGSVKLGIHRKTEMPCAIKFIKKSSLETHEVYEELNRNELEVLEIT